MKNKLLSQNVLTHLFYSLSLMLLCTNLSWGQVQTIGTFPYMDGGFEGQTAGIVPKIIFDATGIAGVTSSSVWNAQTGSGDSTINSDPAVARTGSKYATGVNATATFTRVLQSPTTASGWPDPVLGTYVVQYWIKNSTLAEIPVGVGPTGANYQAGRLAIGTNVTSWTKYTQIATSAATSEITSFVGIGRVKVAGSFLVDDVVVYAGTAADVTPPLAASGGAVSGLNVSWTASSDVDGGGYMVVRYASNPNPDNDPNPNGIYAVGNTITNGTGSLIGTVVYTGTGTSFTDDVAGSVSGSDYYKIYAVDKAFNYATEIKATAVVSNDPTITSSIETLTGFNYTGVGPSASQSFVVSGSKLTNDLVVSTASTDFELSKDNFDTASVSSITLTAPTVTATTLYVRLKANLVGNAKSATVTIASTGANTLPNISLSGSATNVFYYKGSGLLSSNTSWGVNTDGSGTNPSAVTDTYTHFVIANGSATTDSAWTLGTASKVIVGNGVAVSLTVADTFPITGTIDAAANGSVVWQHVLASPTFGTLDNDSEVHFAPAVAASYSFGATTAYGKLFIDGAGKVSVVANLSTVTVKTALTVASGSTLGFPLTNTHSITINAGAFATINGTITAGKQGGLLGTVAGGATTTTVSILLKDAIPNLTLGASSLVDYYRTDSQTVSVLPTGVNYANLTLSDTEYAFGKPSVKLIPGPITLSGGVLTLNIPDATATTSGASNITLVNGATINIIAGTLDAQPQGSYTPSVQAFCGSATVANLVAKASALNWYDTPTGETALAKTTVLTTKYYYVSEAIMGLESTRTPVLVTIITTPNAGTDGTLSVCAGTIPSESQLFAAITGEDAGGIWSHTGLVYNYTVNATAPCTLSDTSSVTVTEQAAPYAGTDGTLTVCAGTNPSESQLFAAITAEDAGGSWSNAGLVYTYTVNATLPCSVDTATVTVTEQAQPNAGTDGTLSVCAGITPTAADLFSALAGADLEGYWSGPIDGVYTYTVNATAPCTGNDTATVIVTELAVPSKPVTSAVTYCQNQTAIALTASEITTATTNWYDDPSVVNPYPNAPTPRTDSVGTFDYYVSQTADNGCESDRALLEVIVYPIYNASICYVSSDETETIRNRIYINNNGNYNVDKYQIFREGDAAGIYDLIGEMDPNQNSFLDLGADNSASSNKYKVKTKDISGLVSNDSSIHKTILLQSSLATNNNVNLSWTTYDGISYGTYTIYRKVNDGVFEFLKSTSASNLSYTDVTANTSENKYSYYVSIAVNSCSTSSNTKLSNKKTALATQIRSNYKIISKQGTLGIEDNTIDLKIKVYPNPVKNTIAIEGGIINNIANQPYTIIDSLGKIVLKGKLNEGDTTINVEHLSKGIYCIKLANNKASKFIKE